MKNALGGATIAFWVVQNTLLNEVGVNDFRAKVVELSITIYFDFEIIDCSLISNLLC